MDITVSGYWDLQKIPSVLGRHEMIVYVTDLQRYYIFNVSTGLWEKYKPNTDSKPA